MGWGSPAILTGALFGALFLAVFIWWELRTVAPMPDLRLFRRKLVALGVAAGWVAFLGTSVSRFMMPSYLQRVLEYSPRDVGLLMIPPALCMVIVGPVTGRLSDRFGWRPFTLSGLAFSAVAWFILATQLSEDSSVALVVGMLMLQSTGTGLLNSANVISVADATAIIVFAMGSLGVEPSLDAVSPEVAGAFVAGLSRVFWLMAGLLVVGMVIVLLRGERRQPAPGAMERGGSPGTVGDTRATLR